MVERAAAPRVAGQRQQRLGEQREEQDRRDKRSHARQRENDQTAEGGSAILKSFVSFNVR